MSEKLRYESLHTHTIDSDGEMTHGEVLDSAEQHGFGAVAFTDHDVLLGEQRLSELEAYDGPVQWVSGVELSAGLPREMGGGTVNNLHIVGLFVDPSNEALARHCEKTLEARARRMQHIVTNLRELGFQISEADCEEAAGGDSIGRPHIAQAIEKYEENQEVYERLEEQAKASDPEWYAEYSQEIKQRPDQRPYRLFLAGDAYLEGVYADYDYWQDFDTCVHLIREAGGVAIWAHWWTIARKLDRDMLEQIAGDGRIDGLETSFPLERAHNDVSEATLQEIAEQNGLPQITAVDLHKPGTFAELAARPDDAETTIGALERLIEAANVDTRWSNLNR